MRNIIILLSAAVFLFGMTVPALADDFRPAPWRGDPLSVFAEWEFYNDLLYDIPPDYYEWVEDGIHPYNDTFPHTHPTPGALYWRPGDGDGEVYTMGVGGALDCFLGNFIDDYNFKHIWVQITFGGQGVPFVYEVVGPGPNNNWDPEVYGVNTFEGYVTGNQSLEYWILIPNPDREYVNIWLPPYTSVDQVIIETISTNEDVATEPATWGMLKNLYR